MAETNNKRVAKNTLFLYFRMILIMLVTLYTSRVVLAQLGIKDYGIYNGRNGYLLPLGSTGADFGVQIKACLERGELERMSMTARDVYREKLNWNVWAQKVEVIIRNILEERNGRNK